MGVFTRSVSVRRSAASASSRVIPPMGTLSMVTCGKIRPAKALWKIAVTAQMATTTLTVASIYSRLPRAEGRASTIWPSGRYSLGRRRLRWTRARVQRSRRGSELVRRLDGGMTRTVALPLSPDIAVLRVLEEGAAHRRDLAGVFSQALGAVGNRALLTGVEAELADTQAGVERDGHLADIG